MANAGTRTNEYKLAMNTFRLEIKRGFLSTTAIKVWNSLPMGTAEQSPTAFKIELNTFLKSIESGAWDLEM